MDGMLVEPDAFWKGKAGMKDTLPVEDGVILCVISCLMSSLDNTLPVDSMDVQFVTTGSVSDSLLLNDWVFFGNGEPRCFAMLGVAFREFSSQEIDDLKLSTSVLYRKLDRVLPPSSVDCGVILAEACSRSLQLDAIRCADVLEELLLSEEFRQDLEVKYGCLLSAQSAAGVATSIIDYYRPMVKGDETLGDGEEAVGSRIFGLLSQLQRMTGPDPPESKSNLFDLIEDLRNEAKLAGSNYWMRYRAEK